MICCNPILVRRLAQIQNAIHPTISNVCVITYLITARYFDVLTFVTTFGFMFLLALSSENWSFMKAALVHLVILFLSRPVDLIAFLFVINYVLLLIAKPCDVYTLMMVVSVAVRILIIAIEKFVNIGLSLSMWS